MTAWLLASLSRFCPVCVGGPQLVLDVLTQAVIPCPHCVREIPIALPRMRRDIPARPTEETP